MAAQSVVWSAEMKDASLVGEKVVLSADVLVVGLVVRWADEKVVLMVWNWVGWRADWKDN